MAEKTQKITVAGFLYHEGKALVVRRSEKEDVFVGCYELPGGKVDFGDDPKESLEREFLEETNLKIIPLHPYRVFTYITHNGNRHTVELVYHVELNDDPKNLKLSEEHDDYAWITEDQIDSYKISGEIKTNIKVGFKEVRGEIK